MTPEQSPKPRDILRGLRIFSIALVAGVVLFAGLSAGINLLKAPKPVPGKTFFSVSVIVAAVVLLFLAYKKRRSGIIAAGNLTGSLHEKLDFYRSVLISAMAICEGAALFSVIIYFLTGEHWMLGITALIILYMLTMFPSQKKLVADLKLDWQEQQQFETDI